MPVLRTTRFCSRQHSSIVCPVSRDKKNVVGAVFFFSAAAVKEKLAQSSRPASRNELWLERATQHRVTTKKRVARGSEEDRISARLLVRNNNASTRVAPQTTKLGGVRMEAANMAKELDAMFVPGRNASPEEMLGKFLSTLKLSKEECDAFIRPNSKRMDAATSNERPRLSQKSIRTRNRIRACFKADGSETTRKQDREERSEAIKGIWADIVHEDSKEGIEKIQLDTYSYQALMITFVEMMELKGKKVAFNIFRRCMEEGGLPSPVMFNRYMRACAELGEARRAMKLVELFEQNPLEIFEPDSWFMYNLIIALSRGRVPSCAKKYLHQMKDLGYPGTEEVYSSFIWACTRLDSLTGSEAQISAATEALDQMLAANMKPKADLVAALLNKAVVTRDLENAVKLLRLLRALNGKLKSTEVEKNMIIAAEVSSSILAEEIWEAAHEWGIERTETLHNNLAVAQANNNFVEKALQTIIDMVNDGTLARNKTVNLVASKASHRSIKGVDKLFYYLASLKEEGHTVPIEAINCIILACAIRCQVDRAFSTAAAVDRFFSVKKDATTYAALFRVMRYVRAGRGTNNNYNKNVAQGNDSLSMRMPSAMILLSTMRKEGVTPTFETYYRLLELVILERDQDVLEKALDEMNQDGVQPNKGLIMLLVRTYKAWGVNDKQEYWEDELKKWIKANPYESSTLNTRTALAGRRLPRHDRGKMSQSPMDTSIH
eukprot:243228_1